MCGIAGIIGSADDPASVSGRVARMISVESHRGPDAGRVVVLPQAVLGHRRLSIIDLSDRGLQPMASRSGAWMVYNGEVYNYRELKAELADRYPFFSDTDSEVLLAAWEEWGEGCLEKLNGMFAFCIYDPGTRTCFLARDRFGQKPLYFVENDGKLLFASEVKALLAADIEAKPDREVWARYLARASYDDTAGSFFDGIRQLMPGECARWQSGKGLQVRRYYDIAEKAFEQSISVEDAAAGVRDLLVDASRLHMRADVPVGISLSGGLDSSALLACLDQAGELHKGVHCFSVDFGGDLTERPWIEAAAGHHGLPSEILSYTRNDFRHHIRPMMWQLEGPLGGLMNCALAPVMERARTVGIRVMQDGTGLDEAFAGYRNHHDLYLGLTLKRGGRTSAAALRDYMRNWEVGEDDARRAAERALDGSITAIDGTVAVRPELLAPDLASIVTDQPYASSRDPLRDALIDYLQTRKIPRNTRMKDRLSMAYGLELRLPFLDHRLVEFALSLPPEQYFLHGRTKSIVREALAGVMDDGVRIAPKRSIQAPQGQWLRAEPMRGYVADLISSESFADRGLFDVRAVKDAFGRFCDGAYHNSFFVWQWINAEEWHRVFIDADPVTSSYPLCREIALDSDCDIARPAVAA